MERMTWIKPSFLWMMYRCGYARKEGQERVLAVRITREGFDWAVAHAVDSKFSGKPAVRVQVNPTALFSMGLGMEDVRTAVAAANVNQAKGNFDGKRQAYTIGANDQILSSDQYRPLVIAYRNGAPVTLSDVASVVDGTENTNQAAWMNGTQNGYPAIKVTATRQGDSYVVTGSMLYVPDAEVADLILCAVRTGTESSAGEEGVTLLAIDRKAPGVTG